MFSVIKNCCYSLRASALRFNKVFNQFFGKWIFDTGHKEVGIHYIIFGALAGIGGTVLSVLIRAGLIAIGNPTSGHSVQPCNILVVTLTFIMIFFMIESKSIKGFDS